MVGVMLKTIGMSNQWRTYPKPDWLLDEKHMWIWQLSLDYSNTRTGEVFEDDMLHSLYTLWNPAKLV